MSTETDWTQTRGVIPHTIEFVPFPKIPRLNRDITITEKIDGTNACVVITEDGQIAAQSRNRLITPDNDNQGFALWVHTNQDELREKLGPGHHFGEWWGLGIQRHYGQTRKYFSLFNTGRWDWLEEQTIPGLRVVPVIYEGLYSEEAITTAVNYLRKHGSIAAPGWDGEGEAGAEGIVVYHQAAKQMFKVLLHNDQLPKGLVA